MLGETHPLTVPPEALDVFPTGLYRAAGVAPSLKAAELRVEGVTLAKAGTCSDTGAGISSSGEGRTDFAESVTDAAPGLVEEDKSDGPPEECVVSILMVVPATCSFLMYIHVHEIR